MESIDAIGSLPMVYMLCVFYSGTSVIELRPTNPIHEACTYGINQWKGFEPYLNDGRIELSNNFVEGVIRTVAIGKKTICLKVLKQQLKEALLFTL